MDFSISGYWYLYNLFNHSSPTLFTAMLVYKLGLLRGFKLTTYIVLTASIVMLDLYFTSFASPFSLISGDNGRSVDATQTQNFDQIALLQCISTSTKLDVPILFL
jgi:type III secretory pathway component EscV